MRASLAQSLASALALSALLLCVAVAGCDRADPLDRIRAQQSAGDFQATIVARRSNSHGLI